jgi:hypothetical protein
MDDAIEKFADETLPRALRTLWRLISLLSYPIFSLFCDILQVVDKACSRLWG